MEQKSLSQFIENTNILWVKDFFINKIDELKTNVLESSGKGLDNFELNINVTNFIVSEMKNQISKINNFEELKEFMKKNLIIRPEEENNFKEFGIEIQHQLMEVISKGSQSIEEKLTEIMLKMQISSLTKNIFENYKICLDLLAKLGEDTNLEELEYDDLDYLLNISFNKSIEKLKTWSLKNPKQAKNYCDELKKMDLEISFEDKLKNSELIDHFFKNVIGSELDEEQLKNMDPNSNIGKKIMNFNEGVNISEELYSKNLWFIFLLKELKNRS